MKERTKVVSRKRRLSKIKWGLALAAIFVLAGNSGVIKLGAAKAERNNISLTVTGLNSTPVPISVAVVGDIHVKEAQRDLEALYTLMREVKAAEPDLVTFVGDYISNPSSDNLPSHRTDILRAFKIVDPIPRAVVLGNYESWSNPEDWLYKSEELGIDILENKVRLINTAKGIVCVRGLGDRFTNRFTYRAFPSECATHPRITITHDPAGAFDSRVEGLVIAGHTHCGQINFPFIGPLWVPTNAPRSAFCGLHTDQKRKVFVTSGVGTSILPIRIGAPPQWDMLHIKFVPE